jgi:hypothetical protein
MAPLGETNEGPKGAIEKLHGLVRALRLFKEGTVGLGPFAFAPVGDDAWRRVETGAAPPRQGSYFLIESEVRSLDKFAQKLVEDTPQNEAIAFAEKRFQFGCERSRPVDALCDHLLAIRSALGGEGVIDAPLAARAAALISGKAEDEATRRRIETALDLEQALINNEETTMIGGESSSYLAAWVEDSTRTILREAVLGKYETNLNVVAEETLITSGLQAGEGSIRQRGETTEWDTIPEPALEPSDADTHIPATAEIHVFKPRVVENFGPEVEAGVDPLFGSVPEFEPAEIPGAPEAYQPMPEIEAALGIEPGSTQPGSTRLLEPVPEPGEIKVSAKDEIGSSLREDWLEQERAGDTLSWPSHAMDGLDSLRRQEHGTPPRKFFPQPEATEWSVSELEYRRNRPS